MSTWRDRIVGPKGSFRGVSFYYNTLEGEIGRRTVVKEFPGRDQPAVEDLGRRTRRFTLEMYVLGDDYDAQRDQLRDALEQPGPGQLVHPYWGNLTVNVDGPVRVRETLREQGVARFAVTFVEAGATLAIVQATATARIVIEAADYLLDNALKSFAASFSVLGLLAAVVDGIAELVHSVTSTINGIRRRISAALMLIDDLADSITGLVDSVTGLLALPGQLAASISGLVNSVVGGIAKISDAFDAMLAVFGGDDATPAAGNVLASTTKTDLLEQTVSALGSFGDNLTELPETTPQEQQAAECQRQLVRLVQVSTICAVSKTATELTYDSAERALRAQQAITSLMDKVLADTHLPDDLYGLIARLRAALVEHLRATAAALPSLATYTPTTTLPALVVAYQIYGDAAREGELLARNPQVRDPSALPGGVPLTVLSDE